MDGARFDIAIEANNLGVDTSVEQLVAFTNKIQQVNKVATEFDRVVAAARLRLEESANATKVAAAALQTAEARYKELESAANKAAKEVERAAAAGRDTVALKSAAAAAAEEMRKQATVVDQLRAKSDAAAAAQSKLAGTLKTLEGQQAAQAAKIKSGIAKELAGASSATENLGADGAASASKFNKAMTVARAGAMLAAAAVLAMTVAAVAGVGALAKFAIESNPAAMMRLTMATERFKLGLKNLVSGVRLDKFVGAIEDIGTLFDKGTSSAAGMKTLVETILQPLLDGAAKAGPLVKEMFKGLIYGAMQVVIAVLKIRNEIFKAMSPETRAAIKSVMDQVFSLENAFKLGTAGAVILAAIFVTLTVALIALAVAEIAALWPILLIVAAVAAVIAILMNWGAITTWLREMWDGFVAFIKRIPEAWVNAAKAMIDGLVKGIKDGAAAVWKAMQDLAGGAIDAFKSKLGIKSPSAVMQLQASYTTQGFVEGLEDGAKDVDAAMQSMVSVPGPAAAPQSAPTTSASSRTVHIAQLNIGNSPVAQNTWTELRALLADLIEGGNITIGGGEAPATSS